MNGTEYVGAGIDELPGVDLVEVGARDGLQNESTTISTAGKGELIERLVAAGARRLEVASFVHPGRVPQMADAEAVVGAVGPSPNGVSYIGLVLNRRGLERALATSVDEVTFVVGASDGFNQANAGVSPEIAMNDIEMMLGEIGDRRTTVTISVALGCPYEGVVPIDAVVGLAARGSSAGADEIALGDTIGVAVPSQVSAAIEAVRTAIDVPLRGRLHDTRNTAVANAAAAYRARCVGRGCRRLSIRSECDRQRRDRGSHLLLRTHGRRDGHRSWSGHRDNPLAGDATRERLAVGSCTGWVVESRHET